MKLSLAWPVLISLVALASCGRMVPDDPASATDSNAVPSPDAGPTPASPLSTLTGHVVTCPWQAFPSFTWQGETYQLDAFVSQQPLACTGQPLTSLALIYETMCGRNEPCQLIELDPETRYRLEGAYHSVELCTLNEKLGPAVCKTAEVFIPATISPAEDGKDESPLAHFLFTAEVAYEEVTISSTEIIYTHFVDGNGKCATWITQAPCWTKSDLTTHRAPLTPAQAASLRAAITKTGFFGLPSTLGDAGPNQRFYAVELAALELNGVLKQVVYQDFPGATSMPASFIDTFRVLAHAVCQHLAMGVGCQAFPAEEVGPICQSM